MPETSCSVNKAVIIMAEPSTDGANFPLDANLDKMITSMLQSLNANVKTLNVVPSGPITTEPVEAPAAPASSALPAAPASTSTVNDEKIETPVSTPELPTTPNAPAAFTNVEGFRNNLKKYKEKFENEDNTPKDKTPFYIIGGVFGGLFLLFIILFLIGQGMN